MEMSGVTTSSQSPMDLKTASDTRLGMRIWTEGEALVIFCFYGFLIGVLVEEIWIIRKSVISNGRQYLRRMPTFGAGTTKEGRYGSSPPI
jgi:hypothetical protein